MILCTHSIIQLTLTLCIITNSICLRETSVCLSYLCPTLPSILTFTLSLDLSCSGFHNAEITLNYWCIPWLFCWLSSAPELPVCERWKLDWSTASGDPNWLFRSTTCVTSRIQLHHNDDDDGGDGRDAKSVRNICYSFQGRANFWSVLW